MESKRRRAGNGEKQGRTSGRATSIEQRIEHLRLRFAKFRRANRAGTRIPQGLREEALGALRGGAPELDVRRACRITREQLERWRQRERASARNRSLEEHAVKVFPVVDEDAGVGTEAGGEHPASELELRIAGWTISIRQLER
jgi:hypothetical protein